MNNEDLQQVQEMIDRAVLAERVRLFHAWNKIVKELAYRSGDELEPGHVSGVVQELTQIFEGPEEKQARETREKEYQDRVAVWNANRRSRS